MRFREQFFGAGGRRQAPGSLWEAQQAAQRLAGRSRARTQLQLPAPAHLAARKRPLRYHQQRSIGARAEVGVP
jgi:hypothetical protein